MNQPGLLLESAEVAPLNEIVKALVRCNFGRSESCPRVMATGLSCSNNDTLKQAFLRILEVPQTLHDGRVYNAAQLMKINEILQILKIPQHRIDDIAADPVSDPGPALDASQVSPLPPAAPAPEGKPEPAEDDQDEL